MPLFEFRCQTCEHEFEALVRANEDPNCPQCQSHRLDKLFSETALPVMTQGCPPSDAPPCRPGCCRYP